MALWLLTKRHQMKHLDFLILLLESRRSVIENHSPRPLLLSYPQIGSWVSQFGYHLRVEKVRRDRAIVDFLDPRGAPIARPYMGGPRR
jgi:hypothetical protein